jgi:hypothetical protein
LGFYAQLSKDGTVIISNQLAVKYYIVPEDSVRVRHFPKGLVFIITGHYKALCCQGSGEIAQQDVRQVEQIEATI